MKIGFLELSHVFANQVKLPYSTGCVWSHCKTVDEISNHFSQNISKTFSTILNRIMGECFGKYGVLKRVI